MWIEKQPEIHDTIKIEFPEPFAERAIIGVVLDNNFDGKYKIDIGDKKIFVNKIASVFVWRNI